MQNFDDYDDFDDDLSPEELKQAEMDAYGALYGILSEIDPSFSMIVESDLNPNMPADDTHARICLDGHWVMTAHTEIIKEYGEIKQSVFIEPLSELDFKDNRLLSDYEQQPVNPEDESKFNCISDLVKQNSDALIKAAAYYDMLDQGPDDISEFGFTMQYDLHAEDRESKTILLRKTIEAYMFAVEDITHLYAAALYKHGATLCPVKNEIKLF